MAFHIHDLYMAKGGPLSVLLNFKITSQNQCNNNPAAKLQSHKLKWAIHGMNIYNSELKDDKNDPFPI